MFEFGPVAIGLIVILLALLFVVFYVKPPKTEED